MCNGRSGEVCPVCFTIMAIFEQGAIQLTGKVDNGKWAHKPCAVLRERAEAVAISQGKVCRLCRLPIVPPYDQGAFSNQEGWVCCKCARENGLLRLPPKSTAVRPVRTEEEKTLARPLAL